MNYIIAPECNGVNAAAMLMNIILNIALTLNHPLISHDCKRIVEHA
jgi:hypothetical protein